MFRHYSLNVESHIRALESKLTSVAAAAAARFQRLTAQATQFNEMSAVSNRCSQITGFAAKIHNISFFPKIYKMDLRVRQLQRRPSHLCHTWAVPCRIAGECKMRPFRLACHATRNVGVVEVSTMIHNPKMINTTRAQTVTIQLIEWITAHQSECHVQYAWSMDGLAVTFRCVRKHEKFKVSLNCSERSGRNGTHKSFEWLNINGEQRRRWRRLPTEIEWVSKRLTQMSCSVVFHFGAHTPDV